MPDRDVWIHAPVDGIGERGFRLGERLPDCLLQCPIDPVAGLIPDYPEQGLSVRVPGRRLRSASTFGTVHAIIGSPA